MSQLKVTTPEVIRKDIVRIVEINSREGSLNVRFAFGETDAKNNFISRDEKSVYLDESNVPPEIATMLADLRVAALALLQQRGSVPAGTVEPIPAVSVDVEIDVEVKP